MPDYDFKSLSPYDFQNLVRDLLQKELDVTLECFTMGRDNGIDLRYRYSDRLKPKFMSGSNPEPFSLNLLKAL